MFPGTSLKSFASSTTAWARSNGIRDRNMQRKIVNRDRILMSKRSTKEDGSRRANAKIAWRGSPEGCQDDIFVKVAPGFGGNVELKTARKPGMIKLYVQRNTTHLKSKLRIRSFQLIKPGTSWSIGSCECKGFFYMCNAFSHQKCMSIFSQITSNQYLNIDLYS